ncbi:MAG: hypothetical protein P1P85_02795 [Patescibacteria group bacterium]|nr:hypothetical protein [Patescibacteria group bacterium]
MKPTDKKFVKIIALIVVLISAVIIVLSCASNKFFHEYKFFDLLFVPIELRTTIEHEKTLGIETAKISYRKEKKLDLMIKESIKAQLEYYSTEKDENLEKVKDLYLPDGFEQYKEFTKEKVSSLKSFLNKDSSYNKIVSETFSYNNIKTIKFSQPRTYKGLPDRIGIINYVNFINNPGAIDSVLSRIFIFKNINGEWKIEKQKEILIRTEWAEESLIQEIKDGK